MKRKILLFVLTLVSVICLAFFVAACGTGGGTDGADGVGISTAAVVNGNLIITLTDGDEINCGSVTGENGENGAGISSVVIDGNGDLIVTLTDDSFTNLGNITGATGPEGAGISAIYINSNGELIVKLTNEDAERNLGSVTGKGGDDGVGIDKVEIDSQGQVIVTYTNGDSTMAGTVFCNHSYGEWTTVLEASCTSVGYSTRTCSICGDVDYQFTKATGHTAKLYTYDNTYHYYYCTACGVNVRETHSFDENKICTLCKYEADYSIGLGYALSSDKTYYAVLNLGTCTDTDLVIPSTYSGLPVTAVGSSAFYNKTALTSVTFGDNITTIGGSAFSGCSSLTAITIPESVTYIDRYAFYGCKSLTNINLNATISNINGSNYIFTYAGQDGNGITLTIGSNVTTICNYLFYPYSQSGYEPKITNVVFEKNSVCTSIGKYAFKNNTSLTSIVIPKSVTTIDSYSFDGCSALTTVYYGGTANDWNSISISSFAGTIANATRYYYAENDATVTTAGNYWYYDDESGAIVPWTKEESNE